jgi:hypothetical protein
LQGLILVLLPYHIMIPIFISQFGGCIHCCLFINLAPKRHIMQGLNLDKQAEKHYDIFTKRLKKFHGVETQFYIVRMIHI